VASLLTLVTSLGLSRLITISGDMTRATTVITRLGSSKATFIAVTRRTAGTITAHVTSLTTVVTRLGGTITTIVAITTTAATFGTVTRQMSRLTARITSGSIRRGIRTITRLFEDIHYYRV
jgi:NH3-dependent NAD+ synthetase